MIAAPCLPEALEPPQQGMTLGRKKCPYGKESDYRASWGGEDSNQGNCAVAIWNHPPSSTARVWRCALTYRVIQQDHQLARCPFHT